MKSIYKYKISVGENYLDLPANFKALHVGIQNDGLYVWILVDLDAKELIRTRFLVFGTGWEIEKDYIYVGTVQTNAGYVWHVSYEE